MLNLNSLLDFLMCSRRLVSEPTISQKLACAEDIMPGRGKRNFSNRKQSHGGAKSPSSTHAKRMKKDLDSVSDANSPKYSLLACGSFNPITNMHLRMFEVARDHLKKMVKDCSVSRGLISPVSDGYGKQGLESSNHRLKMCRLAVKSSNWMEVSSWECDQEQWSPTVDVLRKTKADLESKGDTSRPLLLCGSDLLESFGTPGLWKSSDIETIVKDFGIIVVTRPGYDSEKAVQSNEILLRCNENIHIVTDIVSNDTSSTSVRKMIQSQKSIKYLTQDNIIQYIEKHKLYSTKESDTKNSDKILAPYSVNSPTAPICKQGKHCHSTK